MATFRAAVFPALAGLALALLPFAALPSSAATPARASAPPPDFAEVSMPMDDECTDASCAVNALQLRGQQLEGEAEQDMAELEEARIDRAAGLAAACSADPIADYISQVAPECFRACPALCSAALPVLAAIRGDASLDCTPLHDETHGVACLMSARNAEACRSVTEHLDSLGVKSPVGLLSRCDTGGEASGPAALIEHGLERRAKLSQATGAESESRRHEMLDVAFSGKSKDALCAYAQGKTCSGMHTWIYCANGYRVSGKASDCQSEVGEKSLCKKAPAGSEHDYCDDPFCRNGGAYLGDGKYCQRDSVIYCQGTNAPRVIQQCENKVWKDSQGRQRNTPNHCIGTPPNPKCDF
mmetsp:Transcript_7513/g.21442  ORF Transcript_7513/g.21442 Transcript_7513/m.21442 type:complete len:355 (+) Transcript_7513:120-1184(+)|eukprot:CAMPEP_0170240320 /NCGR_PEP_ID=MMETSP0116_2-20130129/19918_1 /TAXON_ID=400756 /ORGANISM="Durinskia baltica, Strain CSIRO CS-38" /LENGTH=354 /DNA_ID=CAMNT_0010491139 /DNA_START=120 /DNA_END=1184 /DNA_ORIENTATION=+